MKRSLELAMRVLETTLIALGLVAVGTAGWLVTKHRSAEASGSPQSARQTVDNVARFYTAGHSSGPLLAQHTLLVFQDFECPACRHFSLIVDTLRLEYPNVRVIERHWPLDIHAFAFKAALAAECAEAAGAYETVRRALFDRPALLQAEEWGVIGKLSGVRDTTGFANCIRSERYRATVVRDMDVATKEGFRGTPTVFLDDRLYGSMPSRADIERQLKRPSR